MWFRSVVDPLSVDFCSDERSLGRRPMAECLLSQQLRLTDEQLLGRPVGFSLKEADGRLNAAFGLRLSTRTGSCGLLLPAL